MILNPFDFEKYFENGYSKKSVLPDQWYDDVNNNTVLSLKDKRNISNIILSGKKLTVEDARIVYQNLSKNKKSLLCKQQFAEDVCVSMNLANHSNKKLNFHDNVVYLVKREHCISNVLITLMFNFLLYMFFMGIIYVALLCDNKIPITYLRFLFLHQIFLPFIVLNVPCLFLNVGLGKTFFDDFFEHDLAFFTGQLIKFLYLSGRTDEAMKLFNNAVIDKKYIDANILLNEYRKYQNFFNKKEDSSMDSSVDIKKVIQETNKDNAIGRFLANN